MKKALLALLTLLFLFPFSACADVSEEEEESFDEGLVSEVVEETESGDMLATSFALPYLSSQTLDPVACLDGVQQTVGSLLYEGLFVLDESFEPQPMLCTAFEYDAETRTYRFTLRSEALFSDGSPLTAADVLATLRHAQESDRYAARFTSVESMHTSGSTLVVTLTEDNAFFPALLDIPIVKAGTESALVPLGTGPYLFTNDSTGASLTANGNWWRGKALPLAHIPLASVKDNATAAHLFTSHNVQLLCTDLTSSDAPAVGGKIAVREVPTGVMQFLAFNTASPLLSDAALRSAISEAIDRSDLAAAYLSGHAIPAQFPLSPVSSRYPASLEKEVSADNYRRLLSEAGISAEKPRKLTLLVNEENAFKVSVAARIAETLSVDGLSISLKALPWNEYLGALQSGNFDLYYGEVRLTADWNCTALLHTLGALNYGGSGGEEMDSLLADFLSGRDSAAYLNSFAANTPIAPIAFETLSVLSPEGMVENLSPTAASLFYRIEDWQFHLTEE